MLTRASDFVVSASIPGIAYRTNAPEEFVCPRVTTRDGVSCVYVHKERAAPNKGFVSLHTFFRRLAKREPGLMVTGYRPSNGRQTTISFNKWERISISPQLQKFLESA